MEIRDQGFKDQGLLTVFESESDHMVLKFGTVTIPPGVRVPEEGMSEHSENEYSFIKKGTLEGESGGKPFSITSSMATFIPAGEQHWAINSGDEPCEIVWTLLKEK
ncbi:cupin domain-containing protein [Virgibacillus alimentarius]|uniref:Mannose-6-phosphate isomerase-like protein (Cupin superfamily) n=1 Tax=Virgibacillus alimentarius TaxID=698769 RepID=A0ABS4SCB4_9BACI|nr:cupin domain-containing protein [Virgibacillus alimentarius]MBP2259138.1 mannose-6-phosphate isomerase-like protein (cupin superfamily) [Virgibacillus alimentarius]